MESSSHEKLDGVIRNSLISFEKTEEVEAFVEHFKIFFGDQLLCVIFYGSCLSPSTRKKSSYPDFYVVVREYGNVVKNFPRKRVLYSILMRFLPPTVFFLDLKKDGKSHHSKFNLISKRDLEIYTSERAPDMYIFGRLGKRVVLPYYSSEEELNDMVAIHRRSMRMNAEIGLCFLPLRFSLDEFIKMTLSVSYMGDYRVERDTKVDELFSAEIDFYRTVYSMILEEIERDKKIVRREDGFYERILFSESERKRVEKFLKKSRRRSVYRWPKGILTVGNYVDYLIAKVERARGIRIELTPLERKFPLIFGWRHFFRMKREGHLK